MQRLRPTRFSTGMAIVLSLAAGSALLTAGCVFGPTALRASRAGYNEAIRRTNNEQMLLNLVRLRYRDTHFSLQVGAVSAQFEFSQSASVTGQLNENVGPNQTNPDALTLDGSVGFADRPTVSFSPVQGQEFVQQLMTPLTLDTIVLLQRSGWSLERVLRLTVQQINGVDNATRASGPTPPTVPPFEDFNRVCELVRALQFRRALTMGYVSEEEDLSDAVPAASVDGEDLIAAAKEGMTFKSAGADGRMVLRGPKNRLELTIAESELNSPEVRELTLLLGLAPNRTRYLVKPVGAELLAGQRGADSGDTLLISTRALLGIVFYLSQGIEVPPQHEADGLVTVTRDHGGAPFDWSLVTGDLLRIRSRRTMPNDAAVRVHHRGYWFYVHDDDLNSKSTFFLLTQLGALQAGVESGPGPVLTLPVGG